MSNQGSHWDGCWKEHQQCAWAEVERLRADLAAARADYEAFANSESTSAQQLRKDLAAMQTLLYRAYPYIEDVQYGSDEMHLAKRTLLSDIDAALAGEKK